MNCKFILFNFLICTIFASAGLSEEGISLHKLREPGDSLDISIIQELTRSADLGSRWLIARQNNNGSWGERNQIETTALCVLALASQDDPDYHGPSQLAMRFLQQITSSNTLTNFSETAWTTAAFILTETQGYSSGVKLMKSPPPPTLTASESTLRREIILGLNLSDADESSLEISKKRYSELASHLDWIRHDMFSMWLDARVINREGNGQLITSQGQIIDWRRTLARKILSDQKTDPEGGGFWYDHNSEPSLRNTALAILISKEL